jgi:hypothetical protein
MDHSDTNDLKQPLSLAMHIGPETPQKAQKSSHPPPVGSPAKLLCDFQSDHEVNTRWIKALHKISLYDTVLVLDDSEAMNVTRWQQVWKRFYLWLWIECKAIVKRFQSKRKVSAKCLQRYCKACARFCAVVVERLQSDYKAKCRAIAERSQLGAYIVITNRLQSARKAIVERSVGDCKAISDCKTITMRLQSSQSDCKAIALWLQSDRMAIAKRLHCDWETIAKWFTAILNRKQNNREAVVKQMKSLCKAIVTLMQSGCKFRNECKALLQGDFNKNAGRLQSD